MASNKRLASNQPPSSASAALTAAHACCEILSVPVAIAYAGVDAALHEGRVWSRLARCDGGSWRALRRIWHARLTRETINAAMRVGLHDAVLRRVVLEEGVLPPSGCVLAICHSPWGQALARWNATHGGALVKAASRWEGRTGGLRIGDAVGDLRRIMRQLASGGRVALVVDRFTEGRGIATEFLGAPVHVATGAARIALAAGVPLVPMTARYVRGWIRIAFGRPIDPSMLGVPEAMRCVVRSFETEVRADPAGWDLMLHFARTTPRVKAVDAAVVVRASRNRTGHTTMRP